MRSLSAVRIDEKYQILWKKKVWYDCEVTATDNDDSPTRIKVTYPGSSKKYDEWVTDAARVRKARGAEETARDTARKMHKTLVNAEFHDGEILFRIKKVVRRRFNQRKCWRVWWLGYEGHKREFTWEPTENVPQEYIDAYEAEQLAKQQQRQPPKRKRERPAATPWTVEAVAGVAQAVRDQRRDDAEDIEGAAARAMVKRLRKQSTPSKQAQQLFSIECSEARYYALWDRARAHARREVPGGELKEQVTEIVAVKGGYGGAAVEDRFKILNPTVIQPMLRPHNVGVYSSDDLYFRDESTAMQLVGPWSFVFTTTRGVPTPQRLLRVFGFLSKSSFLNATTTKIELPPFALKDTVEGRAWKEGHMLALAEGLRRIGDALPARAANWLNSPTGGQQHVA